jgi:glycosyltransferase involved in cell wall biosynthesis
VFSPLRRGRAESVAQEAQFRVATVSGRSTLGRLRDQLMVPDTKIGWWWPAVRRAQEVIAQEGPALIFSTSPPETAHLVAQRVQHRSGLPWVADLRDGWLFEPPNPALRAGARRHALENRLERGVVSAAQAVVTATAPIAEDLRTRYPAAADRISTITNGYDAAEFAGLRRQRAPDGTFLLVYTGALGSSRQGTSAEAFFAAVAEVVQRQPDQPLRVQVVGDTKPAEWAAAYAHGLERVVTFLPPVSRREAHQHQLDADALLLVTAPGQRSVATLKLFDYIGAGVPVLALAADNAAAEIVAAYDLGITAAPDEPPAIARAIEAMIAHWRAGRDWPGFAAAQAQFERRALAGALAQLFDRLLTASHQD